MRFFTICAVLLAAVPVVLPAVARAAVDPVIAPAVGKLPQPVIAIVDIQRLLEQSLAAKSVQKQLDAQRMKFQDEVEVEENGLRAAEQELTKERDHVSPQAYADHEQKLRQRFSTVENHVQARHSVLDAAYSDAMNQVHTALLAIVDKVAHEHGANIVILKQQAFWTDQPLDITGEVLKDLDQKLPKITITMPPEPASANTPPDQP
ncbi:MAG: OmpH family outer membrane protein [Alphaproteobacteria bacterium]|nr:OmpH family outer membrane protein [Alphaproteobacteria bacterium]